jgi:Ni/Co efflux regulator RcnB
MRCIEIYRKESIMKKILSTIVAALVAVSFTSIVFADDAPYSEHRDTAPAEMRKDEPRREEVKPMEKHYKQKKHHQQKKHKKQIRKEEQHQQ